MSTSIKRLLVCSVAAVFALTVVTPPAHSGNSFATGAIIGGIAGVAIGTIIGKGTRAPYYYGGAPRTAKKAAVEDMTAVQKALAAFGFEPGPVTGKMNPQTKAAIVRLQTKMDWPKTGTLTDDQKATLLTSYAKRNQDDAAPLRVSKIDALFNAIGVNPANAGPAAPALPAMSAAGSALPNFGGSIMPAVDAATNMRTICRDDLMTATLRESAIDSFKSARLVPDQFCVARSSVLADAAESYKAMSKQANAIKPDVVRTECERFAEAKRIDIDKLASDPPTNFARALVKPGAKPAERDAATAGSRICLGFGYADDKPEVVLASALVLVGFGETAYAELIGANLALGLGVTKDASRAATWLEFAAADIDAGAPALVKTDGAQRAKVLRQVVKELQGGTAVAVIPAKAEPGIIAPNLFGPRDDAKPSSTTAALPEPKSNTVDPGSVVKPGKLSRSDMVERMRENVVLIYDGDGGMGTGFFISPTHVLTNTHVVADTNKVVLVNKTIRVQGGIVKFRGMTRDGTGIDAAIVEVMNYRHPTYMGFASDVKEGEDIAIAGYPGRALNVDRGFRQFLELIGRNQLPTVSQIPNTKFAFGVVQSVFTDNKSGLENIQEGVETTGGNSGSPLVNECGEVVALHYSGLIGQVKVSGNQATVDTSKYNFAISFREVLKFLRDAGISYQASGGPCRG